MCYVFKKDAKQTGKKQASKYNPSSPRTDPTVVNAQRICGVSGGSDDLRPQTRSPGPGLLAIPDRTNPLFVVVPPVLEQCQTPAGFAGARQIVSFALLTAKYR